MKALVFERSGDPAEVLALREVPEPTPRAGEVVVAVDARPIHPSDLAFIRGSYRIRPALPQIAGLSGVGRVIDVSHGSGFARGARVAFRSPGAWAERVAVPVERLFAVPDEISDDDGAQLPLNPITAWGLLDMADVRAGDWIGVTAPSSSVARLVTALAETRGLRALAIESKSDDDRAARLRARSDGGLAALLDSVGGSLMESLFGALKPGATIVAYGTLADEPIAVRNATLIYANLTWRGFGIDRWLGGLDAASRSRMLDALFDAMRAKRLPLPVRERLPLDDHRRAIRLAQEPKRGKVLFE